MGGVLGFTLPTSQNAVVWDDSRYAETVFIDPSTNNGNQDIVDKTTTMIIQDQSLQKKVPIDVIPWALAGVLAYTGYQIAKKAKNKDGKPAGIAKYAWLSAVGFGIVGAAGGGMLSAAMYKASA